MGTFLTFTTSKNKYEAFAKLTPPASPEFVAVMSLEDDGRVVAIDLTREQAMQLLAALQRMNLDRRSKRMGRRSTDR